MENPVDDSALPEDEKLEQIKERYRRWQAHSMAQLSVALALLSGSSIALIAAAWSALRGSGLPLDSCTAGLLKTGIAFLFLTACFAFASVISRTVDFRLTARKVRGRMRKAQKKKYRLSYSFCGLKAKTFGELTWFMFWLGLLSFLIGTSILFAAFLAIPSEKMNSTVHVGQIKSF